MAIKKRKDTSPKEGKSKYGDVNFADETNKKYPLDTAAHVKAAASYWGMPKNKAKYSAEDQKKISSKIASAEKKFGIGEHSVAVAEHQIFEAGTHETKNGKKFTYTEADLDEMCETFNPEEPIAYIPGHSSDWPGVTPIPKLGSIMGGLKRIGNKLYAVGAEFTDRLAGWVKEGFYDQRSCEIYKDENGKNKIFAIAMLGAQPPAIKGMPPINASMLLSDVMFSKPKGDPLEFSDTVVEGIEWEEVENRAIEALIEDVQESADELVATLTQELVQTGEDEDDNPEALAQCRANVFNALYLFQDTVVNKVRGHFEFQDAVNELEDEDLTMLAQMSQKIKSLIHYFSKGKILINQQKESDMDKEKEEAMQKEIADLKKQNAEFSTAKIEADKVLVEASDKALRAEIHSFCETNKLNTNKYKEMKIEDVFFAAAKANQTVEFAGKDKDGKGTVEKRPLLAVLQELSKTFQIASPTEGEIGAFGKPLPHEKTGTNARLDMAEKYVKEHPAEFSEHKEMIQKVAAALRMEANSQIKFTTNQKV